MFIVAAICFDYAMVEEVFEWRRVVDGQIEFSFVCFLACVETTVDNAIFECGFERVSLFVCIVRHCETRRLAFFQCHEIGKRAMGEPVFPANQHGDTSSGIGQFRIGNFYIAIESEEQVVSHIREWGLP